MVKAANVTKYDAGGSGDNVIADGYIKTVEKVWLDSYTFSAAMPSGTLIDIGVVPANKKITGVDLYFPALSTGASGTGTTISIGVRNASSVTNGTLLLSAGEAAAGVLSLSANATNGIGWVVSGGTNVVYLTLDRIATTTTAGTIKSIVRYT